MKKKTIRRSLSLICTLALMFSLAAPAFAAKSDPETDSKTYYLENGIEITVTIGPEDKPLARKGVSFSGTATSSTRPIPFNFLPSDGNYCGVWVWNDASVGSNAYLKVTFKGEVNGNTFSVPAPDLIPVGDRAYLDIQGKNGANLSGYVETTIRPINVTSVPFSYTVDQHFA